MKASPEEAASRRNAKSGKRAAQGVKAAVSKKQAASGKLRAHKAGKSATAADPQRPVRKKAAQAATAAKKKKKRGAKTIIRGILLKASALLMLLLILALIFPALRLEYGRIKASRGDYDRALAIADKAEKEDGLTERANSLRRVTAGHYIDDGNYDAALTILAALPADDSEAAALIVTGQQKKADALYEAGVYDKAAELYDLLPDTVGAARYADCLCCMAVEAYIKGDEPGMQQLLLSADGAEYRMENAIIKVTGDAAEAKRLTDGGVFSPESVKRLKTNMQAVLDALSNMPTGKIAVGDRHTVGLRSDGTVIACGDNSFGQCDVSSWTDIVMIAAGAKHTVGLRSDGTVVAAGDSSFSQSEVGAWRDIVMIACSQYDTLGLKGDGTVVTCGMHRYNVANWHDVSFICGGAYSAGCLYNQGTMRSTHKTSLLGAGRLLSSLSISGACSAGVTYDGTLVSSFDGAPEWTDLVRVTVSSTGIFGITNSGEIRSFFFRPSDALTIEAEGSATEIVSSGTHHVVLTSDGRVQCFGNNNWGQCDTSDWQLN